MTSQGSLGEESSRTSVVDGYSRSVCFLFVGWFRGWVLKYKKEEVSQNHFPFFDFLIYKMFFVYPQAHIQTYMRKD